MFSPCLRFLAMLSLDCVCISVRVHPFAEDSFNADNLHFMLQKYLLGQDIFLLSQPGPYARRLAMTFCRQAAVLSSDSSSPNDAY